MGVSESGRHATVGINVAFVGAVIIIAYYY